MLVLLVILCSGGSKQVDLLSFHGLIFLGEMTSVAPMSPSHFGPGNVVTSEENQKVSQAYFIYHFYLNPQNILAFVPKIDLLN